MRLKPFLFFLAVPFLLGWGHWGPKVKIGLSLDHTRAPFFQKLKDAVEDNRADLLVMDANDDPMAQEAQVKTLVQQGIQVLVLFPCDPLKAAPLVATAHQAGIQVISLERLIPGSDLDYLITFNQEKAGELQAKALVKKAPQGHYVLLGGDHENSDSKKIQDGQMKVLLPVINQGDIKLVASRQGSTSKASKELESILNHEGNKVDAVLASDSEITEGAILALEKAKLSGKVLVAGTGDDVLTCRRILLGTQTMTVYHPPQKLAEETAYLAAKLARKATEFDCQFVEVTNGAKTVKAVLLTPIAVDAINLDSTIIKDKVQKAEEIYKGLGKV